MAQTGRVVEDGQVYLGSYHYKLLSGSKVKAKVLDAFPEKNIIGEYSYANQKILSSYVQKDRRGGIGIEEMDESKDANRCWFSDLQLGYRGHLPLPRLATLLTSPTLNTPAIVNADMELDANWLGAAGARSSSFAHGGTYSWKVTATSQAAYDVYQDISSYDKGASYTFTCWVKVPTEAADDGNCYIAIDDGVGETVSSAIAEGSDWIKATVTRVIDPDATRLRLIIRTNCTTYTDGLVGYFDDATITLNSTVGAPTYQTNFNGELYQAFGKVLAKLNAGRTAFTVVALMPATITALIVGPNSMLYIYLGDSDNYQYMTTGEAFTATNVNDANLGIEWDSKLFKIDTDGNFWYATTPNSATPTWTSTGGITNVKSGNIKRLFIGPDAAGNDIIYASTTSVLKAFDFTNGIWTDTDIDMNDHPTGGMGAITFLGGIMISAGLDVSQYVPDTASERSMGLSRDDGLPVEYNGEIVYFTKDKNFLFASVDASKTSGKSKSGKYGWNGVAWEHIWSPPTTLIDDCEDVWNEAYGNPASDLVNGDCELTTGWTEGSRSATSPHGGSFCWTKTGGVIVYQALSFVPSSTHIFKAWIKTSSITAGRIAINDGVSTTYSSYHTGGGAWELLTVTKTLSPSATKCWVEWHDPSGAAQFMDDATHTINVISSLDTTDFQVGAGSVKLVVAAEAAAGEILATEATTSKNLSQHNSVSLRMKSSVAMDASDLQLLLDDTAACASPLETINCPALAADTWTKVVLTLADAASDTAIISVGVKMVVDKGAFTLNIDQVEGQTYNGAMTSAIVSSASSGYALYFDHDSLVYYIDLQRGIRNINKLPGDAKYASSGIHISPNFDAGSAIDSKTAVRRVYYTRGMSANETLIAKYRINHIYTDLDTGWTTLGTITSDGKTTYAFGSSAGIEFDDIQFREDLARGSTNTKTPDYTAVLEYRKPATFNAWSFIIDTSGRYDKQEPKEQEASLLAMAAAKLLQEFTFRADEDGSQTKYVFVHLFDYDTQTGNLHQSQYEVTVVEA